MTISRTEWYPADPDGVELMAQHIYQMVVTGWIV